ncbi:hypothetical protein PENTCL1PPCAC_1843 [Pristionchus entomophagus]|uniref:BTB domain-containing protein n=1 Tax=Pristionchus entomophagus TaxID=358040 RepID=A0AAV5S9V1_9BILA|nr:hypothetical protein PENTCL1PPCAC_1843 [Pristionchus entomophagus]
MWNQAPDPPQSPPPQLEPNQVRVWRWAPSAAVSHPTGERDRTAAYRGIAGGTHGQAVRVPAASFWRPTLAMNEDHSYAAARSFITDAYGGQSGSFSSNPLMPSSLYSSSSSSFLPPPPDVQEIVDNHYPPIVLSSLSELREDEQLCDVELEAEGETILAHRVVLSASIPYFRAMFVSSQMKETTQRRIVLSDISSIALRQLINYVYTSRLLISGENVQQLLFAASILQMDAVSDHCQKYMSQWLTAQNCISLRQFAEQHNCSSLLLSTDAFAVEHFAEIRLMPDFLSIPFTHIRDLINRSDLNVNNEQEVFETVLQWMGEDATRRLHLPDLLQHVRLTQLSCRYLQEVVMMHPFIANEPSCMQQVATAACILAAGISTSSLSSFLSSSDGSFSFPGTSKSSENTGEYAASHAGGDGETRERRGGEQCGSDVLRPLSPAGSRVWPRKSVAGVIFCVGGRGTLGDPFRSVEAYDWRRNRWFSIAEMTTQRRHVGVVSAHGKLYAIGGHDGSNHLATAECYDPAERMWKPLAPMRTCRRGIAVGALEDAIYAVGGLDDAACFQTVERYDIESNSWKDVARMNIQRGGVGVAALSKYLFAVGGNDGTSSLDSCEKYNPHLDQWKIVAKMMNRRAGAGVCVLDGFLYAIGGFDDNAPLNTCERYDMRRDEWTQLAYMSCARGGVGVAAMGGLVYAIGGHDGMRYLNSVEAYDPVLNQWRPVSSIKECRAGAGVSWSDVRVADLLSPKHTHESGYAPYNGIAPCV